MKRTVKITLTILLILFTAGAVALSQEKKDTKTLKVIVENKDGAKVIIDTSFNSIIKADTITTGDGNFIFVTTKDGKAVWNVKEGDENNLMAWTIAENGPKGKVIYISENGPEFIKEGSKSIGIIVKNDDSGKNGDKTNYVIAKDGLVITIEGDDDTKVQEIGKLIESHLGTEKEKEKK